MGTSRARCWKGDVLPFTGMVIVECTNVGLSTIFKAATLKGLNSQVFMLYSYAIAALLLLPLCFFFHRNTRLPPFTLGLLARFFVLGILGFTAQYLGYKGIDYSTPTLASAMTNLTPASTFVLAILFRMEKLALKSLSSQVKILGTVITIAGALVVVLYKGPVVIRTHTTSSASVFAPPPLLVNVSTQSNWIKGGALLAAEYVLVSLWYIYQAKAVVEYPAELIVVFFFNLSCAIIAAPVCLIGVKNSSEWHILKPDVRLFSILYAGLMGSGLGMIVHTWGLHEKGPVYVAMFRPLSIVIAAGMGFIFLGDNLYLGSVIGSFIISLGFYVVMWGKAQEDKSQEDIMESSRESASAPLLKGSYSNSTKGESCSESA